MTILSAADNMAGNREEASSPLDLSRKPVTLIVPSAAEKASHAAQILESKTQTPASDESRAPLDLTKATPPVSFHRAIPVTTRVASSKAQMPSVDSTAGGLESKKFVLPETGGIDLGGEKAGLNPQSLKGDPLLAAGQPIHKLLVRPMQGSPGSRQKYLVSQAPKDVVVTAAETTSKSTEEIGLPQIGLSPNMLTYQQQTVMRTYPDTDPVERTRSPLAASSVPSVIIPGSAGAGLQLHNAGGFVLAPEGAVSRTEDIDLHRLTMAANNPSDGQMVVIPFSQLHRLKEEFLERGLSREEVKTPPTIRSKDTSRDGRPRINLAPHFQPYPSQRPATCLHRSSSNPSLAIQTMSLSPRVPSSSTEGSLSPRVITVPETLSKHHSLGVIQGWPQGTLSMSGRAGSPAPTYSLLGKPQVAASQATITKRDDHMVDAKSKPQLESNLGVLQPGKMSPAAPSPKPSTELQRQVASIAAAAAAASTSTEGSSGQGALQINPFYPLSVAVDCHRATAQDSDGDTPLHIAIVQETTDLAYIQRLIHLVKMSGKSLDIFNYMQQTPLHLAAITNNIEVIRIMLEAGANPNEADRNGQTTVHHACYNRNSPCMHVIFKYSTFDIDLEKRNYSGHTPLHVAVEKYDKVLVRMLLEHGSNVNAMDSRNGWTPLFIAVANKDIKMMGILVEFGAKVNAQSYSGNSALHIATGRGYTDVVKALVQYGADLSLKNSHWDTPVNVANANEMNLLLRGICRGSPTISLSAQSFASEKNSSPIHEHSYMSSYSPPPGPLSMPSRSSSHEDVRNALSNKILHRKLSRDSSTPTSPVPEMETATATSSKKKFKTTKVVNVTIDGKNFPLKEIIPLSDANKIPVIVKTTTSAQEDSLDEAILSGDSGIGSWRLDSGPSLRAMQNNTMQEATVEDLMEVDAKPPVVSVVSTVPMVMTTTSTVATLTSKVNFIGNVEARGIEPQENSMEFTVQLGYKPLTESPKVRVDKMIPLAGLKTAPKETYEKMDVESIGPSIAMKTVDGSAFRFEHMFGTPVASASSLEVSSTAKNGRIEIPSSRAEKVTQVTPTKTEAQPAKTVASSSDFDVTAVPVYRKAMQNGQQMSKFKEMNSMAESLATTTSGGVSGASVGIKRQNSQDSEDEGRLVIVEKGEMRTRPLKKTVSLSCPTSPSQQRKAVATSERRTSPVLKRDLDT